MATNKNDSVRLPKGRFNWEDFDAFPKHCKEFIWYAPTKVGLSGPMTKGQLEAAKHDYLLEVSKDTARVYGKAHPQAWGRELSAADLSEEDFL